MNKIKKVDQRIGQSVMSFGCPCGNCYTSSGNCICEFTSSYVNSKIYYDQTWNRDNGGSIIGGGGR